MVARNSTQRVPVSRTFLPIDPAGMRRNLPAENEQQVEQDLPMMLFDAANIMPTPQGYSSYFGRRFVCEGDLPYTIEDAFAYEDSAGNIYLFALGDGGIYYQGADCQTAEGIIQGTGFEVTDYGS